MTKDGTSLIDRALEVGRKRRLLQAVVFAAILLPTLAIFVISFFLLKDALTAREAARRETVVERDRLFARAVAHGISIYIESALDAVRTAAADASARPMTDEAMRPLITNMVRNTSAYFAATVGDAAGNAVVVFDPNGATEAERYRSGLDLSERDYYKKLIATGRPVVSDAITSLVSPQPTVAIAAPVFDDEGGVRGFVAAGVSLAPLYQLALAELGTEAAIPVVVDSLGQVIVHQDRRLIEAHRRLEHLEPAKFALLGEEGFIEAFTDVDGRERSAAYAPVPGLGWGVWIAQEPPANASLFIRHEMRETMFFYGLILLLNVILALIIWRLIRALVVMRQRERTYLTSIGDGVIAIDRAWRITLWNPTAARLTGWKAQDVVGQPLREKVKFIRESDRKENIVFIEEAMLFGESKEMTNSTLLITRDGREIPVGDSAAPVLDEDGRVAGVIIVFRDVSSERDAHLLRTDFAYASHQLRTPVNKALWNVELLLEEIEDPAEKEKAEIAYRSLKDIRKLSESLLDVTQVDQGMINVRPETVDAKAALEEVIDESRDAFAARNVTVDVKADDAAFDVDPKLMKRCLTELVSNAASFSRPGGAVQIVLRGGKTDVLFEVRDQGIGISEEQQPLVFTKFFRGQNVPADVPGAGLGLFVAKEYAELLGGRIWFESRLDSGSTFYLKLPRFPGTEM